MKTKLTNVFIHARSILTLPAFAHDGPIAVAHLQLLLMHHNEIKFSTAATEIFDGAAFISQNFYSRAPTSVTG